MYKKKCHISIEQALQGITLSTGPQHSPNRNL